jgi:hypothetical protein
MASKLIVNEIEHTDGAGTAVTMAKATIADATLTAGTIASAVVGSPNLNLSNATFPAGMITGVYCSTPSSIVSQTLNATTGIVPTGSSVSYTPTVGAKYVIYEYTFGLYALGQTRVIFGFTLHLGSIPFISGSTYETVGLDVDGNTDSSYMVTSQSVINLVSLDSYFSGTGSHSWKTNAGTSSHSPSADTLQLKGGYYSGSQDAELHKHWNRGSGGAARALISPTTIIYSVM